jgi:hypothetical protein
VKIKNLHGIIFLVIFPLFANRVCAAEWIFLESVATGAQYYNKSNVKEVNKNIISVSVKEIYNDNGKIKNYSFLKKIGKTPINPYILSHELKLLEINCVKEKIKGSSDRIYDKQGNVVAVIPSTYYERKDFVPESVAEKIVNTFCSAGKPSGSIKKSGSLN